MSIKCFYDLCYIRRKGNCVPNSGKTLRRLIMHIRVFLLIKLFLHLGILRLDEQNKRYQLSSVNNMKNMSMLHPYCPNLAALAPEKLMCYANSSNIYGRTEGKSKHDVKTISNFHPCGRKVNSAKEPVNYNCLFFVFAVFDLSTLSSSSSSSSLFLSLNVSVKLLSYTQIYFLQDVENVNNNDISRPPAVIG